MSQVLVKSSVFTWDKHPRVQPLGHMVAARLVFFFFNFLKQNNFYFLTHGKHIHPICTYLAYSVTDDFQTTTALIFKQELKVTLVDMTNALRWITYEYIGLVTTESD